MDEDPRFGIESVSPDQIDPNAETLWVSGWIEGMPVYCANLRQGETVYFRNGDRRVELRVCGDLVKFVEGRSYVGEPVGEFRQLFFASNNRFEEFLVRVYRKEPASALQDFMRSINPALPQGWTDERK